MQKGGLDTKQRKKNLQGFDEVFRNKKLWK